MPQSVTINGHTYTDDSNPTTGLGGGGHRTRFIPILQDVVALASQVAAMHLADITASSYTSGITFQTTTAATSAGITVNRTQSAVGASTSNYGIVITQTSSNDATVNEGLHIDVQHAIGTYATGINAKATSNNTSAIGIVATALLLNLAAVSVATAIKGIASSTGAIAGTAGTTHAGYFDNQVNTGATAYGVYINTTTGATNVYGIYQNGGHKNYLSGDLQVGVVTPLTDNTKTLGNGSFRWSTVYAATGTINTSDAREKTAVVALSVNEINAAKALAKEIGSFQFLSAIVEKGADKARHHIGMTVQRAIEIMQMNNLDPFMYGFICHDSWEDQVVVHPAEIDEAGNVTQEAYEELTQQAGDRYSFRTDELLWFIARGLEARLTALEEALAAA